MPQKLKTSKTAQKKPTAAERCKEKLRRVEDELQEARKEIASLKEKKNSLEKKLQEKPVKKRKESNAAQAAKQATADGTGLIVGDSVVQQIGKTNSSVTARGFQGIRTEQLRHLIEDTDLGDPDVVLVHVGTHDLKRDPLDYIMGDLYDLVSALKTKLPEAKLVISGILRRADVRWERIGGANERFWWVAQCKDALFVDPNSWVKNTDFARNGIYLRKAGGSKLARLFCRICRALFQTSLQQHDNGWGDCNDRDKNGAKVWGNGVVLHGGVVWTDDEEEGCCDDGRQPGDASGDAETRRRREWDESDVGDLVDFNGGDRDDGYGGNRVVDDGADGDDGHGGDGDADGGADGAGSEGGNGADGANGVAAYDYDGDGGGGDGADGDDGDGDEGDNYAGGVDVIKAGDTGAVSEGADEEGTDTDEYDDYNGEEVASSISSIDYII